MAAIIRIVGVAPGIHQADRRKLVGEMRIVLEKQPSLWVDPRTIFISTETAGCGRDILVDFDLIDRQGGCHETQREIGLDLGGVLTAFILRYYPKSLDWTRVSNIAVTIIGRHYGCVILHQNLAISTKQNTPKAPP